MDPIKRLELIAKEYNKVIEHTKKHEPELIAPRAIQYCEPFVGQDGEFSIHEIHFLYYCHDPLDDNVLYNNRTHIIKGLVALFNYASTIERHLDGIFEEDELEIVKRFEWFPSKVTFDQIKEGLEKKKQDRNFRVHIIEGYIGDGKSQLINNHGTFDSELDYFYRAKIKTNSLGIDHMPECFFRVFALLGIYGAFCSCLINGTELFIDRSWLSHDYFSENLVSRYKDIIKYNPPLPFRKLDKAFFAHLFLWPWLFRDTSISDLNSRNFKESVPFYFRQTPIEYPWPFMEHRKMEMDVYKSEKELISHYKKFYLGLNQYFIKSTMNNCDDIKKRHQFYHYYG